MSEELGPFNDLSTHFSSHEFFGSEEGLVPDPHKINPALVDIMEKVRHLLGDQPIHIISGYRSPAHSAERKKSKPGTHSHGSAADFAVPHRKDMDKIAELIQAQPWAQGIGLGVYPDRGTFHIDVRGVPARWGFIGDTQVPLEQAIHHLRKKP